MLNKNDEQVEPGLLCKSPGSTCRKRERRETTKRLRSAAFHRGTPAKWSKAESCGKGDCARSRVLKRNRAEEIFSTEREQSEVCFDVRLMSRGDCL